MDRAETVEDIVAEMAPPTEAEMAEAEYQRFVDDKLPRNFAGHFIHGMLGMTGFRIFNAPTFLPAYLHLITRGLPGSDLLVGLGQSLQQLGSVVSPVVGAAQVEHRKKVLPVSMLMGMLMRVQIVATARVRPSWTKRTSASCRSIEPSTRGGSKASAWPT